FMVSLGLKIICRSILNKAKFDINHLEPCQSAVKCFIPVDFQSRDRSQIDPSRKANPVKIDLLVSLFIPYCCAVLINGGHGTEENYQKAAALEGGPCYRLDSYVSAMDYSRWHGPADRLFHSTNHVHWWQKKRNVVFGRIYLFTLNGLSQLSYFRNHGFTAYKT
ncbi:hypothetical protein PROFUN_15987, partial [Planoprotostelium fungivorum]